jgi:hypothetical protein
LGSVDDAWVAVARPYGFHITITDAIDCTWATIPLVERELEDLLHCFEAAHAFTLQQRQDHPVVAWGTPRQEIIVLLYDANDYLKMLHTLLVARLHPLGTGSGYLQRALAEPPPTTQPLHLRQRTRLFYSPTVFDSWQPHFTLFNPYTASDQDRVTRVMAALFRPFASLTVRSLCLLVQAEPQGQWQIYREVRRPES